MTVCRLASSWQICKHSELASAKRVAGPVRPTARRQMRRSRLGHDRIRLVLAIDPLRPFRHRPDGEEAWLQLWDEATRWWVDLVQGRREVVTAKEGARVRAVLESIRLRRPGAHYDARVGLRDVDGDGWRFDTLSIVADSVKIESFPSPEFTASGITVIGSAAIDTPVASLDGRATQWHLGADGDGRVEVRRRGRGLRMTIEPVVDHDAFEVELVALRWQNAAVAAAMAASDA
jgi:hypothetical protein